MALSVALFIHACEQKDPEPVNEEEVITTVRAILTPEGGGTPITLTFYDEDGEHGSIAPVYTVSGDLLSSTSYVCSIELLNETVDPPLDISGEVREEGGDHLLCFVVEGDLAIEYADTDSNGLPLGLSTKWLTGGEGLVDVTIVLRHQAGTKTGDCPGTGDTDVEVSFSVKVL